MKLIGIVKVWNQDTWTGRIEADGKSYLVLRDGFKRGTKLAEGMTVTFDFVNRLDGPTAHNVVLQLDSKK